MSELDEAWELALAEAHRKAQAGGRADIADYIRLRASNDLLRKTAINWLLGSFMQRAGDANRAGASLQVSRTDDHRFIVHHATMVGPQLTVSVGVRSLFIEAGWPRVPTDWFIRGGGLACGRVRHYGREALNQELMLIRANDEAPTWVAIDKLGAKTDFRECSIDKHFEKLLSADYK